LYLDLRSFEIFSCRHCYAGRNPGKANNTGVGLNEITIGPFLDTADSCRNFSDYLANLLSKFETSSTKPLSGSLPSTNSLASSITSNEVLKYSYGFQTCICLHTQVSFCPWTYKVTSQVIFNGRHDEVHQ